MTAWLGEARLKARVIFVVTLHFTCLKLDSNRVLLGTFDVPTLIVPGDDDPSKISP
ncbi:MAG: hypothetical protein ABWY46_17845 [Pseudomonas sp.]